MGTVTCISSFVATFIASLALCYFHVVALELGKDPLSPLGVGGVKKRWQTRSILQKKIACSQADFLNMFSSFSFFVVVCLHTTCPPHQIMICHCVAFEPVLLTGQKALSVKNTFRPPVKNAEYFPGALRAPDFSFSRRKRQNFNFFALRVRF